MREIEGMSVLITGGGSGIGAGTARYLAQRGARVTITGRRKAKVDPPMRTAIGSPPNHILATTSQRAPGTKPMSRRRAINESPEPRPVSIAAVSMSPVTTALWPRRSSARARDPVGTESDVESAGFTRRSMVKEASEVNATSSHLRLEVLLHTSLLIDTASALRQAPSP